MKALRQLYKWGTAVVVLGVLVQIGAAGFGAFNASEHLGENKPPLSEDTFDDGFDFHTGFGYIIFLGTIVLFLLALGARVGRPRIWWNLAFPVLVAVQIVLAWISEDVPFVGIFHGLGALAIFGRRGSLVGRAWMESRRRSATAGAAPAAPITEA